MKNGQSSLRRAMRGSVKCEYLSLSPYQACMALQCFLWEEGKGGENGKGTYIYNPAFLSFKVPLVCKVGIRHTSSKNR